MPKLWRIDIENIQEIRKKPFLERIKMVLDLTDLPIEPLVYTNQEFSKMVNDNNPLIVNVLETGIKC